MAEFCKIVDWAQQTKSTVGAMMATQMIDEGESRLARMEETLDNVAKFSEMTWKIVQEKSEAQRLKRQLDAVKMRCAQLEIDLRNARRREKASKKKFANAARRYNLADKFSCVRKTSTIDV